MMTEAVGMLCSLIMCILDAGTMIAFLRFFFQNRGHRGKNIWFYIAGVTLLFIAAHMVQNALFNFLTTIVVLLLFSTLYETSMLQKIFAVFMLVMTLAIMDAIVSGICFATSISVLHDNMNYFILNEPFYYMLAILTKAFTVGLFVTLRQIYGRRQYIQSERAVRGQYVMMLTVAALCSIMSSIMNLLYGIGKVDFLLCAGINGCVLVIHIVVYMMYDQAVKVYNLGVEKSILENEYQNKQAYFRMLESHQQEIRTIKHDMKNRLLGILAEISDRENAEKEICAIMNEITASERPLLSENPAVNVVLNAKCQDAKERQIQIETEIRVPAKLELSAGDIGILLGNLLDNAIEAAQECELEKRHIWLKMYLFHNGLVISCVNTTRNRVISLETSKADRVAHGIGLKSIDEIVEKYHGERRCNSQVDRFEQEINLWL